MRPLANLFLGACFAAAVLSQAAFGQSQFTIRSQQGQVIQNITDGATLTFASEGIGLAVSATLTVTYRGSATATLGGAEISGATDFSATSSPALPLTLNANESVTLVVQFNPTVQGRALGRLSLPFNEGRINSAININLVGVLPDFGLSFTPLPRGNQNSIPPGGTITFPDTLVNQTNSALFIISNRGTGPGTVDNIVVTGTAFTVGGVPLLPAIVPAGQELRITIIFSPTQLVSSTGSVRVDFVNRSAQVNLAGLGIGAAYSYEFIVGSTVRPIAPDDTLTIPQTALGERTTAVVRVRNAGNGDGTLTNIRVTGATEITLSDVPFLPLTLPPGGGLTFTVNFAPVQAGTFTARLRVDDAFFNVSAVGLGATLTYAATVGTATTTVANNGNIILPPTQVGARSVARLQVSNTGNSAAFVNSISITSTVFTLTELPALPVRVGGGETISFSIAFAPVAIGSATATLRVDNVSFNVSGVGTDPPALPTVNFPGPTAVADAGQQLSVGVTLASAYPVNLTGRLVLSFASDAFNDDPAIQFAAGGRTLNFVVPANSTRALFGLNATEARFQTGTVAGVITLAATFSTEAGSINLTPTVAPATTVTIRPAAPRIRSVQLSARTASSFTLLVTGFATSRSVTQMAFQFTAFTDPANRDLKLDTTNLTVNVDGPFSAWYQSTPSQPFGSQFTATVSFNVRGDVEAIQSVAVTASNAQGASNSMSVNLR